MFFFCKLSINISLFGLCGFVLLLSTHDITDSFDIIGVLFFVMLLVLKIVSLERKKPQQANQAIHL